jgi:hypothetical protein
LLVRVQPGELQKFDGLSARVFFDLPARASRSKPTSSSLFDDEKRVVLITPPIVGARFTTLAGSRQATHTEPAG